jgi:phosphonate transport system permease protein
MSAQADKPIRPRRFERPSALSFIAWVLVLAFVVWSFSATGLSFERLARGVPTMGGIIERMFPPNLERLDSILASLLVTFQMAVTGCVLGLILSFPLAVVASEGISPHPLLRFVARTLIAFFRTVPDLVWALLFVIAVGLGPPAGVLAIMVDTIGYAGRFFAEAMEETDKGPREALDAIGARRLDMIMSAVVPNAMPNFIATSLFCVEKATRASVVLGLVGAGGIGIELKVAFDLFSYDTAATIILVIFALVVAVEQVGASLRRRII